MTRSTFKRAKARAISPFRATLGKLRASVQRRLRVTTYSDGSKRWFFGSHTFYLSAPDAQGKRGHHLCVGPLISNALGLSEKEKNDA